ncbi:MAG: hypothetical protein AAGK37_14620 [Pseudomonadota bacterium]
MTNPLKLASLGIVALGIAGCAPGEVGSQLDDGWFGEANVHNTLAQMCYGPGGKGGKNGVATDPLVVLDPTSTQSRPIYRVHCDGQLNGKYAQVIFREYVDSATSPPDFGIQLEASE